MSDQPTDDLDVDLDREDFRDYQGNRVTREYVQRALADILDDHTPWRQATCAPSAHR